MDSAGVKCQQETPCLLRDPKGLREVDLVNMQRTADAEEES